ncbi:MAG TPA: hypothetical protein VF502_12190 [Stellaceae bacterium]
MSTDLRLSALVRLAALVIALSLPAALVGCAGSTSPDDSYFMGTNHAVPAVSVGVGVAG